MEENSNERAVWVARYVMPHDLALRRWLRSRQFSGIDIDDVVQETYAVLCALPSFDHIRNPKQYAFQTAYSIIVTQLRRANIVSITSVADLEGLETVAEEPSPERQVCDCEELKIVQEVIDSLPQRVRDVFVLRRIEKLSQREVAQRLGLSENVVVKCVGQGVRALAAAFKRGGKMPLARPISVGNGVPLSASLTDTRGKTSG